MLRVFVLMTILIRHTVMIKKAVKQKMEYITNMGVWKMQLVDLLMRQPKSWRYVQNVQQDRRAQVEQKLRKNVRLGRINQIQKRR